MNTLEAIMADLLELEPSLKGKEPQVRAIVAAIVKAKPDTQFDQTFADKLKAQLLVTAPDGAPATRRAWYFSVPAWSLASASAAALLLVVVTQLDMQQNSTPIATPHLPQMAHLARNGFGTLQFTGNTPATMERGGGGEESTRLADDSWTPTVYEFILPSNWMENVQLPTEAPVYTVGRGSIAADISSMLNLDALRNLNLSVYNVSAENSERNISVSYDTANDNLSMYFNNVLYQTEELPTADATWLSEEVLIGKARQYAEQYGIPLEGGTSGEISDQYLVLYARANAQERRTLAATIAPPTAVTVTFRKTIDNLPVYRHGETQITLTPTTGELISLTAPLNWHTNAASTYATLTDTEQIATYFRWGGTVDPTTWYPGQTVIKQQVQLEQPTLVYNYQSVCTEQSNGAAQCNTYLVPSLSATVIPTEEYLFRNDIIIPLSTNQP